MSEIERPRVIIDTPTLSTGISMGFVLDVFFDTGDWRFFALAVGLLVCQIAFNIWDNKRFDSALSNTGPGKGTT